MKVQLFQGTARWVLLPYGKSSSHVVHSPWGLKVSYVVLYKRCMYVMSMVILNSTLLLMIKKKTINLYFEGLLLQVEVFPVGLPMVIQ